MKRARCLEAHTNLKESIKRLEALIINKDYTEAFIETVTITHDKLHELINQLAIEE